MLRANRLSARATDSYWHALRDAFKVIDPFYQHEIVLLKMQVPLETSYIVTFSLIGCGVAPLKQCKVVLPFFNLLTLEFLDASPAHQSEQELCNNLVASNNVEIN